MHGPLMRLSRFLHSNVWLGKKIMVTIRHEEFASSSSMFQNFKIFLKKISKFSFICSLHIYKYLGKCRTLSVLGCYTVLSMQHNVPDVLDLHQHHSELQKPCSIVSISLFPCVRDLCFYCKLCTNWYARCGCLITRTFAQLLTLNITSEPSSICMPNHAPLRWRHVKQWRICSINFFHLPL